MRRFLSYAAGNYTPTSTRRCKFTVTKMAGYIRSQRCMDRTAVFPDLAVGLEVARRYEVILFRHDLAKRW